MRYAVRLKAEPGWFVALVKSGGDVSLVELKEWGMTSQGYLVPLHPTTDNDFRQAKNFIALIDPSVGYDEKLLVAEAKAKAIKLGLITD